MSHRNDAIQTQARAIAALLDRVDIFIWYAETLDSDGRPSAPVTEIDLGDTDIDDDALRLLEPFAELEWLCLEDTPITDAGLARLKALKGLRRLELAGTKVSDAAVAELSRSLPQCRIDRG